MRVGFLNNQIDNRGTGNALFDYAHFNETILKNESVIFTLDSSNPDPEMQRRLLQRFGAIHGVGPLLFDTMPVDFLYHIKYGNNDGLYFGGIPYGVHAVFDGSQPHGDRYATISPWMGKRFEIPFVPHVVDLASPDYNFRRMLNIPADARVFGRHGGADSFDIPWVWEALNIAMKKDDSIYAVFLNTNVPEVEFYDPNRVIFLPNTADKTLKASFIYACTAMLHARSRGETFGIAVGEFAIANKPVLTYAYSGERAHIEQLKSLAYLYEDTESLVNLLLTVNRPDYYGRTTYLDYHPFAVMQKFKEVFL